jgi:hypothetical protein
LPAYFMFMLLWTNSGWPGSLAQYIIDAFRGWGKSPWR